MEKLPLKTKDLTAENIAKLAILFPNLITEVEKDGKVIKTINASKLKEVVGDYATSDSEVYELTWVGKQESKQKIVAPITKTLRPVPGDSEDFENTENLYIEGDNFEVLKVLQESYLNKIKMIYIDPPYNTGKDFVYKDNRTQSKKDYDEESGAIDKERNKLFKNTTTNGRFHSDWLSMMYERLVIAKDLLSDDGAIFISIGDKELANLRKICDEIFGEGNFVAHINRVCTKGSKNDSTYFIPDNDYILVYAKDIESLKINKIRTENTQKYLKNDEIGNYKLRGLEMGGGGEDLLVNRPNMGYSIYFNPSTNEYQLLFDYNLKNTPVYEAPSHDLNKKGYVCIRPISVKGKPGRWRWSAEKFMDSISEVFIDVEKKRVYTKDREKEFLELSPNCNLEILNTAGTIELGNLFDNKIFDFPKPVLLIKHLLKISSDLNDTILDFFSGSATTAHAVMQLNSEDGGNRKFIMIQLPEETEDDSEAFKAGYKNICEIGKERIRRAAKKIKEDIKDKNDQSRLGEEKLNLSKLDFGFRVFRLDSSNMKEVYYNPNEINQRTLTNLRDNIKEDRTDKDLLYQILLDWGVPISARVEEQEVKDKTIYRVDDNYLIACFDENIDLELVKEIAKLNPLRLVFKDSSFKDDSTKINVFEYLKHKLPNCIVKVI